MNKALKAKWVKALRSSYYKQTTRRLARMVRGEQRNCCLGVLCRVMGIDPRVPANTYHEKGLTITDAMERQAGMSSSVICDRLTDMNDGSAFLKRQNFREIADYIEKEL